MSSINRNTKAPPPFRLDSHEFPALAHSPAPLDLAEHADIDTWPGGAA